MELRSITTDLNFTKCMWLIIRVEVVNVKYVVDILDRCTYSCYIYVHSILLCLSYTFASYNFLSSCFVEKFAEQSLFYCKIFGIYNS